jgi:RecT family
VNALVEQRPNLVAGGRPAAIVPRTMDEAYRLGKAICAAGMAPKGMDTPEKCMIAIMRGLEVGLSPMQAIDKIAIVNGRPTIWGDGALGLVRASGLCEWVRETLQGSGDYRTAVCEVKRKGEPDPIKRAFSVQDAKRAGLWNKQGPWQQYPERMLGMRARAFALRDGFADILGGLYLQEEMEGVDGKQPRRPPAPPSQQIEHRTGASASSAPQDAGAEAAQDQAPASEPTDYEALVAEFEDLSQYAQSLEDLDECAAELRPHMDFGTLPDALRTRAQAAFDAARQRLAEPEEEAEPPVDPEDADYKRGRTDFAKKLTKCLNPGIRGDEDRFRRWQRGWLDAQEEAGPDGR